MKKNKNKIISLVLVASMPFALFGSALGVNAQTSESVRVKVVNDTYSTESGAAWSGTILDEKVTIDGASNALDVLKTAFKQSNISYDLQESQWSGFYIAGVSGVNENDAAQYSGWMGIRNDWVVNEGLSNISVKDGDTVTLAYSVTMGADIGADWMNASKSLKSLTFEDAQLTEDFSTAKDTYTITLSDSSDSIKAVPVADNKYNQVRIYKNAYTPESDDYYRSTDLIPMIPGDTLYIGVGNESWPGSVYGVDEKVYTINTAYNASDYEAGDVNLSGDVDITDATLVQMYCAKLIEFNSLQTALAEMNEDNKADITDATLIQMKAAKLI